MEIFPVGGKRIPFYIKLQKVAFIDKLPWQKIVFQK
jgi:hypothetical protein